MNEEKEKNEVKEEGEKNQTGVGGGENDRKLAVISYVPVFGQVIWWVHRKRSELVNWHGKQGFVLTLMAGLVWWVFKRMWLGGLVVVVLGFWGVWGALRRKKSKVPGVYFFVGGGYKVVAKKAWAMLKGWIKKKREEKKGRRPEKENISEDGQIFLGEDEESERIKREEGVIPGTKEAPKEL